MSKKTFEELTLCSQCSKFPFLFLNKENPHEILIKCEHCGNNKCILIHDYLYQINSISYTSNETKNNCDNHNQRFNKYCTTCKLYLCNQCNNHESHQIILLENIISTTKINIQVNEGYQHINKYCKELIKDKLNECINKINRFQYSYQLFNAKNKDILKIIQLMIRNYNNNQSNYYLRENINNIIMTMKINLYKCLNESSDDEIIRYYNTYNILKDPIVNIHNINNNTTIREHSNSVNSLLLLLDGRLASCSSDLTIKIYNIKNNYHCDMTINTKHSNSILYISQIDNNKIISCSKDKSIKIWSITQSSYQCDCTIKDAHEHWIFKIIVLTNNRIASCSFDETIKIWNSNHPYKLIKILKRHINAVTSIIQLKDKEILV